MAYSKKSFLLKSLGSKGKTVLTLETDCPISVSGQPIPENMSIHAFYDEYSIHSADEENLNIDQVCAICVTDQEGRFVLTGELQGDFDWEKAKSNHRLKYSIQKEEARIIIPVETPESEPDFISEPVPYIPKMVEIQTPGISNEEDCPIAKQYTQIDPFPQAFGKSNWYKVGFPVADGSWHYIIGEIYKDGAIDMRAVGVPGEYALNPPGWLEGFNTYMNADAGAKGYWVMFYK